MKKPTIEEAKKKGLTRNQYIRFYILVPFYDNMETKRQAEQRSRSLTKASAHHHYDRAIELIEEVIKEWGDVEESR